MIWISREIKSSCLILKIIFWSCLKVCLGLVRQQREWLGFTKFGLLSWKTFKTLYLICFFFWQLSIVINNNPYLYTIYLIQEPLQMLFCICVVHRCVTARNELALTHPRALLAKFAAKLSDSFLFSLSKRAISWWQRTLKKKTLWSLQLLSDVAIQSRQSL